MLGHLLPRPDLPAGDTSHRRDHVGHERRLDGAASRPVPRAFANSVATGELVHAPGATSSPPTCNHGESNIAASAPNTASTNGIVVGRPGQSELSTKR